MSALERRGERLPDGRVWLGLAAVAALGAVIVLYATGFALGVTADGAIYFDAATRLSREGSLTAFQHGVVKPLTHFPPLFPAVLSLGLDAGVPILTFGRLLNAVLLALTVFGTGAIVWIGTRSVLPTLLAAALVAFAADVVGVHAALLSEALFLPLQVATLLGIGMYVSNGSRRALLAAAVAAGLACLSRFPGLALVGAGCAAILLLRREAAVPRRLAVASLFATLSCAPLAIWLLTRMAFAGTATNRDLAFHPVLGERLRQALNTMREWLLPQATLSPRASLLLLLGAGAVLTWVLVVTVKRGGASARFALVHVAFAICYCAVLLLSVTLVDAQTRFDRRILLPLHVAVVVPLAIGVHGVLAASPRAGRVALALTVLWMSLSAAHTAETAARLHANGYGYTGTAWTRIDVEGLVRSTRAPIIYTNAPEGVYFATGEITHELPSPINRWTREPNPEYGREHRRMLAALGSGTAAIIYFHGGRRPFGPGIEELAASMALPLTRWQESALVLRRTRPLAGVPQADSATPAEVMRR